MTKPPAAARSDHAPADRLEDRLAPPLDPDAAARATLALDLIAVDPGLGLLLVGRPGPHRRAWLDELADRLRPFGPVDKLPPGAGPDAVIGGLDLEATLAAGRPVALRGLLARVDGGVLLLPQAELLRPDVAAQLAAALDTGERRLERDGLSSVTSTRFGVVALAELASEGGEGGEPVESGPVPWSGLVDRLGVVVAVPPRWRPPAPRDTAGSRTIAAARDRLRDVEIDEDQLRALCVVAARLGIGSLRSPVQAARAARASAALRGSLDVEDVDLERAAELVLAPRRGAHASPPDPPPEADPAEPASTTPPDAPDAADPREPVTSGTDASDAAHDRDDGRRDAADRLADRVLAAARTTLPPELLAGLDPGRAVGRSGVAEAGRRGARRRTPRHGRPLASRVGQPRAAADLDVLATIRAAAPWQRARRSPDDDPRRLRIRPRDFRVRQRERRDGTLTIFAVDASGSQTLHRLAETKGAVELLLAEGYARRDRVALVTFRDRDAEVVLPPTRALARARRVLSALPGGGATPLAAGLVAAHRIALRARRDGLSPAVVLLTDGRANVARDGSTGRGAAEADALGVARAFGAAEIASVVIDTSRRGSPLTSRLAEVMRARHARLPVPRADQLGRLAREVAGVASAG